MSDELPADRCVAWRALALKMGLDPDAPDLERQIANVFRVEWAQRNHPSSGRWRARLVDAAEQNREKQRRYAARKKAGLT